MKRADAAALDPLEDLLSAIRGLPDLKERACAWVLRAPAA